MAGKGKRFEGKVVVVTGASSGMGFATAELVASEGGTIVAMGRKKDALEAAAAKLKSAGAPAVEIVAADVATEAGNKLVIDTALDKFGRVDGLFANAGMFASSPFVDMDDDHVDSLLNTNVKSVVWGIKYAMKAMVDKGIKGSIVINSSAMAAVAKSGFAGAGLYSASKAAADMLVQYAAIEGAEHGIRVNSIRPGIVATGILGPDMTDEKYNDFAKDRQLIGRAGRPQEVAGLVALLLSDDGSFISGSVHTVDGLFTVT